MSGRHKFSKLREEMERDPVRRKRMEEKKKAYDVLLNLASLAELRRERGVTQAELAEALEVSQPNVSKIESAVSRGSTGSEVFLSTLAGYVEALGGRLELRAVFDGDDEHESDVAVPVGASAGGSVGVEESDR